MDIDCQMLLSARFLGDLWNHTRGNAALLVALSMPVLIGGVGLAVDTAQWFLWKHELQSSTDQAAIGAAWALTEEHSKDKFKVRALQQFDANQSVTRRFASSPEIQLADYAGGENNSVIVSSLAGKRLAFSSFLTNRASYVHVRAQASFVKGGAYNACLVALADETEALQIGGNADVRARCGLAALSCEEDAIVIDGSATVVTDSIATCGTVDVPDENQDVVSEGLKGLTDKYQGLSPPENPVGRSYSCKGKGKNKSADLEPGTYVGGITVKCATFLNSGIYVIDGGELDVAANYDVIGTNVMFVLRNGAKIKFGGNGNGNKITLTPMVVSDFFGTAYAAQADQYQGMLVFEDRDNNSPNPGHILNGNSRSLIEGLIYLPSGKITVLGTANVAAQCLQISAHRIRVSGNADLQTLCPVEETTSVGTSRADVRLVA